MSLKTFFINSTQADYGEEEFNYLQKFLLDQGVLHTQGANWNDFVDLAVSEKTVPDMSVDVAIGNAVIETIRNSVTFKVFVFNNAIVNLPIIANASGVERLDAVVLKLSRTVEPNALMSNVASLEVVVGSGAVALSDNDIQTALGADYDFIRLANVAVADGATSILDADIADTRTRVLTTDAVQFSPTVLKFKTVTADPTTPAEGEMWYNTTANVLRYYDGASTINIQASTYTGGNGINVTAGVVSVDLYATYPGLEFNGGKLKAKVGTAQGDLVQLLASGKLPVVDGSNLTGIAGAGGYIASDTLLVSADTERSSSLNTPTKLKEIQVPACGTYRLTFDYRCTTNGNNYVYQTYKNGVAFGTDTIFTNASYLTASVDILLNAGDKIQIYVNANGNSNPTYIRNFRLKGTLISAFTVTQD